MSEHGSESENPEPEDIEPSHNHHSTDEPDPNSYDEPDDEYYQDQDEAAVNEHRPSESSLDIADELAVDDQRSVEPHRDEQPTEVEDFGRATAAGSNSIRSNRQDEQSFLPTRGSRQRRPVEESGPHDENVFM